MKKLLLLFISFAALFSVFFVPATVYAADEYRYFDSNQNTINAIISGNEYIFQKYSTVPAGTGVKVYFQQTAPAVTANVPYYEIRADTSTTGTQHYQQTKITATNGYTAVQQNWTTINILLASGAPANYPSVNPNPSPSAGVTPQKPHEAFQYETPASWTGDFVSMFNCTGGVCDTYEDWIQVVWAWALTIAIPLSVLILSAAGVIWMTSEGNPERITLAKRLITGVLSGLGLLILARIVLVNIIGIDSGSWNAN